MACMAMKNYYQSKNSVANKLTCNCTDAPVSIGNQSVITGLGCGLAIALVWAILATTRPTWLRTLKTKSINAFAAVKIKVKDCSPESGTNHSEMPTPAAQEPAVESSHKTPKSRPRIRACPYRRTETQLRRQIKRETVQDLRHLIKLAKLEAKFEVEAEARAETRAQVITEVANDISNLLTEI